VLHVAREGIEAIEAAGGGIVEPGASLRSGKRARREMRLKPGKAAFRHESKVSETALATFSNG
jgi:hypothetical protein